MGDVTTHQMPWHTTGHHPRQRTFTQSSKLQDVLYEIRGPVHEHASRLEAEGHRILKLNIGNPAPFGFEAPDVIMRDIIQALPYAQGYSDSKGIMPARRAVFTRYELVEGFPKFDPAKPNETDFQLQQALVLAKAMAAQNRVTAN